MAKLREDEITKEDLIEYLDTQDDFALEMYAYKTAIDFGFLASHSGTYEDPASKKIRQYDIRAELYSSSELTKICLAIECKCLRLNYPLVVSRVARTNQESFHELVMSFQKPSGTKMLQYLNSPPAEALRVEGEESLYPPGEFVGKSLSQIGRNLANELTSGDSEVYDKWYQALASAHQMIQDSTRDAENNSNQFQSTLILPILVISDGTLWVADHANDGARISDPHQVNQALLYVGRDYWEQFGISFTVSHLHICTKTGLHEFLSQISDKDYSFWYKAHPENLIQDHVIKFYSN